MAIDNPEVIDVMGLDRKTGRVTLTVSDHLEWGCPEEHFTLLKEKVEAYVRFVQSGQLLESYPKARDRQVEIKVVFKHSPAGLRKLDEIGAAVERAGLFFSHEVLSTH
jgi:hypothetical protein